MSIHQSLAYSSIYAVVNRGMDFIVREAKAFVEENKLYDFSKSQLHGICGEVDNGDNFANLQSQVKTWLEKQAKKRSGEDWNNVKGELLKKMFDWDETRITPLKQLAKIPFRKQPSESENIDEILTDEKLTSNLDTLKFKLARSFFYSLLTFCRCYEQDEIRKRAEEMEL